MKTYEKLYDILRQADDYVNGEKIAQDSENHLKKGGSVFLEINQKLGKETLQLFQDVLTKSELVKDLSENDRFVIGEK